MTDKTGGPAFPGKATLNRGTGELMPYQFGNDDFEVPGMTLRDFFAAKAMQGMIGVSSDLSSKDGSVITEAHIAAQAYAFADAMIAERSKGE